MDIQWYPGHMVKTQKLIKKYLSLTDFVLELIDARAPVSTSLPQLDELIGSKDLIVLLNKADLAEQDVTSLWIDEFKKRGINTFAVNAMNRKSLLRFLKYIEQKYKIKKRPARCMVIGVPNVGKSSVINQLAGRKAAKTGDIPGITKGKMWLRVGTRLEILDTPGILWPKFEDKSTGIKIALLGCIKGELLDLERLSLYLIKFLAQYYPKNMESRYKVKLTQTPIEVLRQVARNRGFLLTKGEEDLERTARTLINEFRRGMLGGISLEKPGEQEGFWQNISNQDNV
jgi:ribosome biogenesis GTPase A